MMTAWTGELAAKVVNTQSDSGFILKVRFLTIFEDSNDETNRVY